MNASKPTALETMLRLRLRDLDCSMAMEQLIVKEVLTNLQLRDAKLRSYWFNKGRRAEREK